MRAMVLHKRSYSAVVCRGKVLTASEWSEWSWPSQRRKECSVSGPSAAVELAQVRQAVLSILGKRGEDGRRLVIDRGAGGQTGIRSGTLASGRQVERKSSVGFDEGPEAVVESEADLALSVILGKRDSLGDMATGDKQKSICPTSVCVM